MSYRDLEEMMIERGLSVDHTAFELPADQFDAQHETLIVAGYQPRDGKHPVLASRIMYIDDPDGNEVKFICQAPAA